MIVKGCFLIFIGDMVFVFIYLYKISIVWRDNKYVIILYIVIIIIVFV